MQADGVAGTNTLQVIRTNLASRPNNMGDYVNAGAFRARPEAERRSSQLRDRGFDARVEYF